jgi:hypothetical protein
MLLPSTFTANKLFFNLLLVYTLKKVSQNG